jgi:hypothetical protein
VLKIVFEGKISPSQLSLKELAKLLPCFEDLFLPVIFQQNPEFKKDDITISLIGIEEGSCSLSLASPQEKLLITAYLLILKAVTEYQLRLLPFKSIQALQEIIAFANRYESKAHFIPQNTNEPELILPEEIKFESHKIKEIRPIRGKIIRVGGKTPAAQIEVLGGKLLNVKLQNEGLAKRLAEKLYEFVKLEGQVTWNYDTGEIEEYLAIDFVPFEPFKKAETIKELAREFGKYFADIEDVDRYVEELRGG